MNVADGQTNRQRNEPGDEKRGNSPFCDRNVGEDSGGHNGQRDDSHQRLVEDALQQDQREISVHGRAEHRHHGGLGNEFANDAGKRRRNELNDSSPHDGRRAKPPGELLVVRLQIHGQHDGQRVGDDARNIVDVHVGCDVGSALALCESYAEHRKAHGADKESQRVAGQQVGCAESHGDANGRK